MFVNFRARWISRGAHKLIQTFMLKKKKTYVAVGSSGLNHIFNNISIMVWFQSFSQFLWVGRPTDCFQKTRTIDSLSSSILSSSFL